MYLQMKNAMSIRQEKHKDGATYYKGNRDMDIGGGWLSLSLPGHRLFGASYPLMVEASFLPIGIGRGHMALNHILRIWIRSQLGWTTLLNLPLRSFLVYNIFS